MVGLSRTEMNFVATFIDSLGGVWGGMMSAVFIFSHFSRLFRGTSALGVRSNFSGMNLKRFTTAPPQRRPRRSHLPQTGSTWSHLKLSGEDWRLRRVFLAYLLLGLATLVTSLHMSNTWHGQVKKPLNGGVIELSLDCQIVRALKATLTGIFKFSVGIIGLLACGGLLDRRYSPAGRSCAVTRGTAPICASAGLRMSFAQVPEDVIGRLGNKDH